MVRLVFRPYTRLGRSICTSESLRSSTRVSPGFDLVRHRSPSFGSQRVGSVSVRPTLRRGIERHADAPALFETGSPLAARSSRPIFTFIAPRGFRVFPTTRPHVRLLGPCFKTGRVGPDNYFSALKLLMVEEKQVTAERTDGKKRGGRTEGRDPSPRPTPTTYVRHPAGRRVLLGRSYYEGGTEIEAPRHSLPHDSRDDTSPFNNLPRKTLTVRPSKAHSFNPLDGFTHY